MKRDLRSVLLLPMFLVPFGHSLEAQNTSTISSVRVYTNPTGARFMVDGLMYTSSQTFLWPAGSKHILQFAQSFNLDGSVAGYQESLDGGTHFSFSAWTLSNGAAPSSITDLVLVADPTITSVVMNTAVTYRVRLRFSSYPLLVPGNCSTSSTPQDAPRSGLVIASGICFGSDGDFFASGAVPVLAYPFPGWNFGGWSTNGGPPVSYSGTVTVAGPITLAAQFILAKRVSFRTFPPGLNLLIDRTPTPTLPDTGTNYVPSRQCPGNLYLPPAPPVSFPALCFGDFDFIPGSAHTVGAASPQYDSSGSMWVIDSFSNGAKPNDTFIVSKDLSKADIITAKFVPGMQAAFLTNPSGLKISIDGRSNWLSYDFAWGLGSTHTVTATDQVDSKGRKWTFKGWSNGGTPTQTFSINAPIRWTANFEVQPQVTLQSNPSGLTLQVDGASCPTPCTLDRPAGTIVKVTAPSRVPIGDTSRLVFSSWSDGATNNRAIAFDAGQRIMTINYDTQYLLAAAGDPSQGVTFSYEPSSPDMFFSQDTGVTVKAQAKGGYRFRRWDGDLSGSYGQGTVLMGAPRTVVALLDRVPYIAPAGIHNAAGTTPDGTVAPGSLIAIAGESLTATFQAGRTSPLTQSIGDVTVGINDRLLPLVYVSPQEIRAQLCSDLADGNYTLVVHSVGQPDVPGQFTVARNSPGLFPAATQPDPTADTPLAWAIHSDGSAVTPDAPAVHGETITAYGTGFGPVDGKVFDGFPSPTDLKLVDQLQLQAGDMTVDALWSGSLGGQVGVMAVKFKITDDFPTATTIRLAAVVNGKTSNLVTLPLQ